MTAQSSWPGNPSSIGVVLLFENISQFCDCLPCTFTSLRYTYSLKVFGADNLATVPNMGLCVTLLYFYHKLRGSSFVKKTILIIAALQWLSS